MIPEGLEALRAAVVDETHREHLPDPRGNGARRGDQLVAFRLDDAAEDRGVDRLGEGGGGQRVCVRRRPVSRRPGPRVERGEVVVVRLVGYEPESVELRLRFGVRGVVGGLGGGYVLVGGEEEVPDLKVDETAGEVTRWGVLRRDGDDGGSVREGALVRGEVVGVRGEHLAVARGRGRGGGRGRRRRRRRRVGRRGRGGHIGRGRRHRRGGRVGDELRGRAASKTPIQPNRRPRRPRADRSGAVPLSLVHRPRLGSSEHREDNGEGQRARRLASPRRARSAPSPPEAPPRHISDVTRHRRLRLARPRPAERARVGRRCRKRRHQRLSLETAVRNEKG